MTTITVYSKPYKTGCFQCDQTKNLFDKAGVIYTSVDITAEENADAFRYITEELGYAQVPVVVVDNDGVIDSWYGLNPVKIKEVSEDSLAA